MSSDLDPVPGLPLLTTLWCNSTTVKKKTTVTCAFPDALYTKKTFYGGPFGAGIGAIEIFLIAIFMILSVKMKHDVTKAFLAIVYIPLGLSSIFKVALGVYGTLEGAYGWCYMVFLMFYNWLYTTAILNTSIGSVVYLAALIIIARKRQNFHPCDSWISYFAVLFFSALLSGSYHFIASQWNQLPASGLFFTYILSTVGIVAELLVCICVATICKGRQPVKSGDVIVLTGDPVVDDARSRLGWGVLAVIIMNIPQWFEIYVKITELFTPYLWDSDDQKTIYYRAQSITLLTFDTVRIFLSFFMFAAIFVTVSGRFAIDLWIHRKPHPNSKKDANSHTATHNKVFVATQHQPLLMDTGEKKEHHHHEKKSPPPKTPPSHPAVAAQQHVAPLVPIPNQVPVPVAQAPPPPQYPGIGFGPGMLQLPHNMQTTIVYTPAMAYENINGHVVAEQLK